jgi:hypothetical protein
VQALGIKSCAASFLILRFFLARLTPFWKKKLDALAG